jgi:hypothetical protein
MGVTINWLCFYQNIRRAGGVEAMKNNLGNIGWMGGKIKRCSAYQGRVNNA